MTARKPHVAAYVVTELAMIGGKVDPVLVLNRYDLRGISTVIPSASDPVQRSLVVPKYDFAGDEYLYGLATFYLLEIHREGKDEPTVLAFNDEEEARKVMAAELAPIPF